MQVSGTQQQALCHLGRSTSPFSSGYFGDTISVFFFAKTDLDMIMPFFILQVCTTTPSFLPLRWSLTDFFAWNCDLPDLSLLRSLKQQAGVNHHAQLLVWMGSQKHFAWMASS
jgi:hypothetical protein